MLTRNNLAHLKKCDIHIIRGNDKVLNNCVRRQLQIIEQKESNGKKKITTTTSRSHQQRPLVLLFYFKNGTVGFIKKTKKKSSSPQLPPMFQCVSPEYPFNIICSTEERSQINEQQATGTIDNSSKDLQNIENLGSCTNALNDKQQCDHMQAPLMSIENSRQISLVAQSAVQQKDQSITKTEINLIQCDVDNKVFEPELECQLDTEPELEPQLDVGLEAQLDVEVEPRLDVEFEAQLDVEVVPRLNVEVVPRLNVEIEPRLNDEREVRLDCEHESSSDGELERQFDCEHESSSDGELERQFDGESESESTLIARMHEQLTLALSIIDARLKVATDKLEEARVLFNNAKMEVNVIYEERKEIKKQWNEKIKNLPQRNNKNSRRVSNKGGTKRLADRNSQSSSKKKH
ncbi:unnamed protein product [Rotaria sordida]|uniref:Uncharacterized protein n=1 Tax=Rotaria sordida TaxID=392033 RepID=A0A814SXW1_9BILA|nr:unnamed protein product [Rotaria sordida]